MEQYLKLLKDIKEKGTWKNPARSNMPKTLSLFGYQYRCNLSEGFPLLTTKKMSLKNISTELLWFLRGGNPLNIRYLVVNGCNIWNQDSYRYYCERIGKINNVTKFSAEKLSFDDFLNVVKTTGGWIGLDYTFGDCPLGYELWRNFNGVDQIEKLILELQANPEGRRHLLTAYDPSMKDFALAPCHVMAQFNCREIHIEDRIAKCPKNISDNDLDMYLDMQPKYYLDCQLYQRSCDVFLGVPYNTASYALLTHIIAEICGFSVGEFVHTFGDVHIYENHMDAVNEQLKRTPDVLPTLELWKRSNDGYLPDNYDKYLSKRYTLDDFIKQMSPYDFTLSNYNPQNLIKADLSVGL